MGDTGRAEPEPSRTAAEREFDAALARVREQYRAALDALARTERPRTLTVVTREGRTGRRERGSRPGQTPA